MEVSILILIVRSFSRALARAAPGSMAGVLDLWAATFPGARSVLPLLPIPVVKHQNPRALRSQYHARPAPLASREWVGGSGAKARLSKGRVSVWCRPLSGRVAERFLLTRQGRAVQTNYEELEERHKGEDRG